jgi:hypothetical protein
VDITYQLAMFGAILAASSYFLIAGTIGFRHGKEEVDVDLHK